MKFGTLVGVGIIGVMLVVLLAGAGSLVENLDAGHILVIQYPRGEIRVGTEPGWYPQWWGTPTKYPKRDQFTFQCEKGKEDASLPVTFNDGGTAKVCGQLAWEMPSDPKSILDLHVRYRSHEAIERQLVRPVVAKSITFSGPLMSSTESFAARKSELLSAIEDQVDNGIYKTESRQVKAKDLMTGVEKTVTEVILIKTDKGTWARQDQSPLEGFGIRTFNLAIEHIVYSKEVADQIRAQQEAVAKVQTAIANAKEAEQRAITAAKDGEANAAKAKWEQEVIKAREVTAAQQRLEIATKDAQAAEQTKRRDILLGEGEATRKRLVMEADGALKDKLDTYIKSQEVWANALAQYQGAIVPNFVSGGSGPGGSANGFQQFMEVMAAKTAKDLAVDIQAQGVGNTRKK